MGIHPNKWLPTFLKLSSSKENKKIWKNKNLKTQFIFYHQNILHYFLNKVEKLKFDIVIHLAAVVGGRAMIEENLLRVGIDIAIDSLFFDWLVTLHYKPKKVVYASSSSIYPIHLQTRKIRKALKEKDVDFAKDFIGKPDLTYGWSKLTGEYLARIAWDKYKQNIIIMRPFSGYGEDQDLSYPVPSLMSQVAHKKNPVKVWGTGNQGRDFIHISDCVRAYELLLKQETDKLIVSNLGSGKLTTFNELIHLAVKTGGYKPKIKPLIDKPVGVQYRYADMKRSSLYKLGWRQLITLREGLTRVIAFICSKDKNLKKLYESYYMH